MQQKNNTPSIFLNQPEVSYNKNYYNMKMNSFNTLLTLAVAAAVLFTISCVPARQYEDLKALRQQCEEELSSQKTENIRLNSDNNELSERLNILTRQVEGLRNDTAIIGQTQRRLQSNYDRLNSTYNLLLEKNRELLEGSTSETQKILRELQATQENLQRKEDDLIKAEAEMLAKKQDLEALSAKLNAAMEEMKEKEEKMTELQNILDSQDKTVNALRESVSSALLGFEGEGLSVDIKNGKVYVSLEETLLFASGRFDVDARGVAALKELAKVLERNPDINVLIEGHTDNVPYRGTGQIRDNWDLSVMRATAIVKILLQHGDIDPTRLTAAGRGEYMPVDEADTREARARNRRTEIILTPKLDKLFQIIETN